MKLLITGDWHLTDKTPRCRIDDYQSAQIDKIKFIFMTACNRQCSYILQPGDLTDKHFSSDRFKAQWIDRLKVEALPIIISVPGQHDMRYHTSDLLNTPYWVIKVGAGFRVAYDSPICTGNINIYGAGWGKSIPKIQDKSKLNILITHRMIVADKLWAGQESYEVAGTFLRRYGYDLVVSGDNHTAFGHRWKDKVLLNCGSLMRNRIDQKGHKPTIAIYDTGSREYETILIPVEPFDKVVDIEEAEKEEKENKRLNSLRDVLKKRTKIKGLDYKKRVFNRVESLKKDKALNKRTEKFIGRIMGDD